MKAASSIPKARAEGHNPNNSSGGFELNFCENAAKYMARVAGRDSPDGRLLTGLVSGRDRRGLGFGRDGRRPDGHTAVGEGLRYGGRPIGSYEILAGRVAVTQSRNPRIKAFAQQMIDDHTRTRDALGQAAAASGLAAPPPAMSSDQAAMLGALQSLRGAPFDQAYAKQQVLAHQQALAVEQSYASAGTDPNLRAEAQSDVPMIQHHLQMAMQIQAALGGS